MSEQATAAPTVDLADAATLLAAGRVVIGAEQSEQDLRRVLEAIPAAIYTTDAAGRVTFRNAAAAALAGREPVLGEDLWYVTWRLYEPDGTPLPHDRCPHAIALKENRPVRGCEAIAERPDGSRVPILPFPTPLHDEAGNLIGAVNLMIDISDRKFSDKARAYLAAIVESSDDAIISKNLDGIVTSWNRAAETMFGYRADEMLGQPICLLFPPDRLSEEDMILERLRRGESVDHFETVRHRKDGSTIDVSLTISPVRDERGQIIGASKIARDITDRKCSERALSELNENLEYRVIERTRELSEANQRLRAETAERERAEAALGQAQKMEAIGQLASGLAHDFNNLLTAILGNLELVESRLADESLRKLVQAASRSVLRGAELSEQMLAFSRKQHLVPRPVDLNALIGGMSELLQRSLGGTVRVATATAPNLWPALVDPTQIEMVILNLAINARDALPDGGTVRIATRNVEVTERGRHVSLAPGDYVCIAVCDDGLGMAPSVLARACEPFFTTKEPGKGSGLGLSQAYGVVRQSGGDLVIDSAVGKGTVVELYLPRCAAPAMPAIAHARAGPARIDGGAMILVVDDQADVREVAASHLLDLGYRVVSAGDGRGALELLSDRGDIDLLVADYAMAGMTGIELAQAARARCPGLPIVIMTGYADVAAADGEIADAILLKKPYRLADLAAVVARALPSAQSGVAEPSPRTAQAAD